MHSLTQEEYNLFLSLIDNPLASNRTLSKTNPVSKQTISKMISNLKNRNILKEDVLVNDPILHQRTRTHISSRYRPSNLGLVNIHILFSKIHRDIDLNLVRQILTVFPYSRKISHGYAKHAFIYATIDVPTEIVEVTHQLISDICESLNIRLELFMTNRDYCTSQPDFSSWDNKTRTWNFNQQYGSMPPAKIGSRNDIERLWKLFESPFHTQGRSMTHSIEDQKLSIVRFDKLDLYLIRELEINAKVSPSLIAKDFNKNLSTISKRIKKLRQLMGIKEIVLYNRDVFNLHSTSLITGKFRNDEINREQFQLFVTSGLFPFESKLIADKKKFLWFVRSTTNHSIEIAKFCFKYFVDVNVRTLDPFSVFTKYLNPTNLGIHNQWRTSREFLIAESLNILNTGQILTKLDN